MNGEGTAAPRAVLFWGLAWRSVLWYAAGAGLGGAYGCAFLSLGLVGIGLDEEGFAWATVLLAALFIAGGAVCGWVLSRRVGARPLTGAAAGVFAGISLPGMALIPFSAFALAIGGALGRIYGLAPGLASGLATAALTSVYRRAPEDAARYRRVVVRTHRVLLLVLSVLLLAGAAAFDESLRGTNGLLDFGIAFVLLPGLVLWVTCGWLSGRLADGHARRASLRAGHKEDQETNRPSASVTTSEDPDNSRLEIPAEGSGR